ncbi:uncharacterized protein N7479_008698 [Penicillium vulpinum]|uniref:uncharacterized protein n=1 Tax=Penicillium vulpinum TaxID=29845 RepID=UPI002547DC5D|nr:uncharacterized protein N7479_008698 [Penicillium vulpinum]KAJ5950285.1 hypothetical protein N7479_008698 [Penicillium vulpinum]
MATSTESRSSLPIPRVQLELEELQENAEFINQQLEPTDHGPAAWKLLGTAFVFESLLWGFPLSFGVFQNYYSELPEFAGNPYISVVGTVASGISYLGAPFTAPFIKRFQKYQRQMIWVGWPICIIALISGSFASTLETLILTQGVAYGVGFLIFYYPILNMVNEYWVARRGMAYGLLCSASGVSGAVMPFIMEKLLNKYGYRTTLRAVAVALFVLTGPLIPFLKGRLPVSRYTATATARSDWSFLRSPLFWVYSGSNVVQGLGYFFPSLYLPSYARSMGMSSTKGALLLALMSVSQVAGQFTFGLLSDRKVSSPALPMRLASQHRHGNARAIDVTGFSTGAYNICCTVTFDDGFRVLVRFPILGRSRFRTEKTRNEISVMRYLSQQTNIPVPLVIGAGRWGCGPYIVMTFIEGTLLSKRIESSLSLNSTISGPEIEHALHGMARIILELSKSTFPCIGALVQELGVWKVVKRPLTLNMNELVRVGNIPPDKFAGGSFCSAHDYFQELAAQQFIHLKYQRNDVIEDELDCRKRYIARCLFRKIAQKFSAESPGPFRLYCDDFRPGNVLVSGLNLTVTGVIDWEYTYVAPAEFTYAAPWWLLFESPEAWEPDLNEFLSRYTPRLQLFLKVLRFCEDQHIQLQKMNSSQRLSDKMAQSMDNGVFWFCLAARKSFMFDDIYWTFLDQKYFGSGSLEDRLLLLSEEELDGLKEIVLLKI